MFDGKGSNWNGIGTLLALFGIGKYVSGSVKDSVNDISKRTDAKATGKSTYIDSKGKFRSTKTNNIVVCRTDNDGYNIEVDIKTGEIVNNEHRKNCDRDVLKCKESYKRMGLLVYRDNHNRINGLLRPVERRVCDDLPVEIENDFCYHIPIFKLVCGKDTNDFRGENVDDLIIIENRRRVLDYCYWWYVDGDVKSSKPHPTKILEEAKLYNIFIYPEDIQFGLERIKDGTIDKYKYYYVSSDRMDSVGYDTTDFRYASWCDKKHWINDAKLPWR